MNQIIDKMEEEFMERLADTSMFVESLGGKCAVAEDMIDKLKVNFNKLVDVYKNTEEK